MNTETKVIGSIIFVTIAILVGGVFFLSRESGSTIAEDQVVARNGLHWHPKLEIYIKGKQQKISKNLGIAGQIHQELHTHDESGTIHMEMKGIVTKDETKLGNFFRIWGKEFSSTQIFDKKNSEEGKVKMTVNGKENTAFDKYLMKDRDNIEIRYE